MNSSTTMTDSLLLSLRASQKVDPEKDSLPFLISRITEQRGSFRNITEQSLREEIRAQEIGQADTIEESEEVEHVQDAKSRREELATARDEMLRQVTQAHNESSQALDFVSLLLSQHVPQQVEKTINPYIKNALPLGVLGTDTVQVPQQTEAQKESERLVSIGWKMQSLNSVADSLLNSASRLEQEIERETKYWEKVLAVKGNGWSICRLPREKHTLGVKYGFSEAYADFRERGMAALRRDDDGDVILDKGPHSSGQILRVQIVQTGQVISTSQLPAYNTGNDEDYDDEMPIERQILQARNSIFDEELHSELHREARNLVNQGVQCFGDTIQLPYKGDKHLEIDLIDPDQDPVPPSQEDDNIATAISLALRILLSHAHRQNLHRRSQPPPPIADSKRPRPIYPILKPIIENIRHRSDVQTIKECLSELTTSLSRASLSLDSDQISAPLSIPFKLSVSGKDEAPATDILLNALTSPLHTAIDLRLPSQHTSLSIHIRTNLFPPTLGTEFQATITSRAQDSSMASISETMTFTTSAELEEHILHILILDLVSLITENDKAWEVVNPHTGTLSRRTQDKEGKFGTTALHIFFEGRRIFLEWQTRKEGLEGMRRGLERWDGSDEGSGGFVETVRKLGLDAVET